MAPPLLAACAALVAHALGFPGVAVPSASASVLLASQDPLVAPVATLSSDGRTALAGGLTLSVSQVHGLDPHGQTLRVIGSGFDPAKGIYVGLCVVPPPNSTPSPCGGGVDMTQSSGSSAWVSTNPPSYGVGLARPYGAGGTFDVTIMVSSAISSTIDCRMVRCAVTTRNDHTRGADRSQDVQVPVAFAVEPTGSVDPPPPAPAVPTPPTDPQGSDPSAQPDATAPQQGVTSTTVVPSITSSTTTTTPPAPSATVADDGLSVSDGTRELAADATQDLDPEGQVVSLGATGLDPDRGVFVSLCALGAQAPEDPDGPDSAPGPCASGSGRSIWFSNHPPAWGADRVEPFPEGSFEAELDLAAVIDAGTDCREVRCGIVIRSDGMGSGTQSAGDPTTNPAGTDRSVDLALPVSFASEPTAGSTESPTIEGETVAAGGGGQDSGGLPTAAVWAVAVAVLGAAAASGGFLAWRRRTRAGNGSGHDTTGVAHAGAPGGTGNP
ncbi:MAG: hypothetical protein M9942_04310 [Microthrixaceae bacterium]|nr:hypothetical protein [Microthrixaceae bacterium]